MRHPRHTALVAFVILTSSVVGQPPLKPNPDGKAGPATEPVVTFTGHATEVLSVRFLADGKKIASVSAKDVRSWHADSGKEIVRSEHPGGPMYAIGPDGPDGPTLARVEGREVEKQGRYNTIVLSAAVGDKKTLTINPHDDREKESPMRGGFMGARIAAMTFSPDGKRLVTAGTSWLVGGRHGLEGGAVKLWDAETGKQLRQLGEVKMWDKNRADKFIPPDAKVIPGVSTSSNAGAVTFSADGRYVAAGTDGAGGELPEAGEVWIWNAADGKLVRMFTVLDNVKPGEFESSVSAVALSHDNKRVAAAVGARPNRGDGLILPRGPASGLRIWEVASGREVHTLRGHKGSVTRLAFSPDGKWLASAGGDRVVRLWDTGAEKEVVAFPFDAPQINTIAFSPDGKLLAAGGGDGKKSGEVKVWAIPSE